MKISVFFLVMMTLSVFANANICNRNWLVSADDPSVISLINAGAGPDQICNTRNLNRPLHQALRIDDRVDASVIKSLINAGADIYAQNILGEMPIGLAQSRFDRISSAFLEDSSIYQREKELYDTIFSGTSFTVMANKAHNQLCDLDWWREISDTGRGLAVQSLLSIPGVDPNYICNSNNNDRIVHQVLSLTSFTLLTFDIYLGIKALGDDGADLTITNDSDQSAVSLAKLRYDLSKDRTRQTQMRWCGGEINSYEFVYQDIENEFEVVTYAYITSSTTEESYDQVMDKWEMEVFNTTGRRLKSIVCPYIGIDDYR